MIKYHLIEIDVGLPGFGLGKKSNWPPIVPMLSLLCGEAKQLYLSHHLPSHLPPSNPV